MVMTVSRCLGTTTGLIDGYAIDTKALTDVTFTGPAAADVNGAKNGLATCRVTMPTCSS